MRQYIVRETTKGYVIGHLGWFRQWKTDWSFDYISDLLDFVSLNFMFDNLNWEFPMPTFEISDKTPMGGIKGINSMSQISRYRYLSIMAKDKNFDTKTADLCFVYSDKENMYKVVDRPYDSFKGSFKKHFCLPCWSTKAFDKYTEAVDEWTNRENERTRVSTKYFRFLDEYEEWRDDSPYAKILSFTEMPGPWSPFNYEVTYEYKNADRYKITQKSSNP